MPKKRADGRYQKKVCTHHDDEGNPVYKFVYAKSKEELDDKVSELKRKISRVSYIDTDTYPLGDWLDEWINTIVKDKLRQNTWESYETVIRLHLKPKLGSIPLGKLQPQAIRKVFTEKITEGYSGRSVQYMHTILSAALKQAVIDDILIKNPCMAVQKPRKTKKEINPLSQEQTNTFLATAKNTVFYTILFLAWGSGLRREELLGLRWKDVDTKKGTITVNQTVIVTKDGPTISEPKNKSSYRTIPIQKEIITSLQSHKVVINEQQLQGGLGYTKLDLVFPRPNGLPRDPRQLSKDFKAVAKKAGLPDKFTLHDLRHTHATQLLALGIHPKIVQYRLGHSTFQQTMDTYSHVLPQMQDGIADMLSGLLTTQKAVNENHPEK